jgi:hypothetical protein
MQWITVDASRIAIIRSDGLHKVRNSSWPRSTTMSTPTLTRLRVSSLAATRIATLRDHVAGLFPAAVAVQRTRATWLWGIAAVVVGTVISLARTTGAGPFQTIWEEDARDLLTDALDQPMAVHMFKPAVGRPALARAHSIGQRKSLFLPLVNTFATHLQASPRSSYRPPWRSTDRSIPA